MKTVVKTTAENNLHSWTPRNNVGTSCKISADILSFRHSFTLVCFIIFFDFFVVTTIKTTTYSTATTVTDAKEHDPCPDCLRKDFAYVPKKLLYQPITGQLISEHIFLVNNCIVPKITTVIFTLSN